MKNVPTFLLCAALASVALPARAQQPDPPSFTPQLKLPEELNDALRDMMEDLKPTLDETLKLMESFGAMGDPRHYHLPEILPNGDIILRRREDAPPYAPAEPDATPEDEDGVPNKGIRT